MNAFTAFDWIALAIVVISALVGLWRGVVREVFALGAWVAAAVCMVMFGPQVARVLNVAHDTPWLHSMVGYIAVFIAAFMLVSVAGFMLARAIGAVGLGFLDRALGLMFGCARGVLIMTLLVLMGGALQLSGSDWWKNSVSARQFESFAAVLRSRMQNVSVPALSSENTFIESEPLTARKVV